MPINVIYIKFTLDLQINFILLSDGSAIKINKWKNILKILHKFKSAFFLVF